MWRRRPQPPGTRLLAELETAARRPCSPVQIVGLRGLGDRLDEWYGAGADVHALAEVVRARLAGRERVELYRLPYEQGPSWTWPPTSRCAAWDHAERRWLRSELDGYCLRTRRGET